jgi:hypothetical protein
MPAIPVGAASGPHPGICDPRQTSSHRSLTLAIGAAKLRRCKRASRTPVATPASINASQVCTFVLVSTHPRHPYWCMFSGNGARDRQDALAPRRASHLRRARRRHTELARRTPGGLLDRVPDGKRCLMDGAVSAVSIGPTHTPAPTSLMCSTEIVLRRSPRAYNVSPASNPDRYPTPT